jgi:hypothetical protein
VTRAGEKLYSEPGEPRRSVFVALIRHPDFRRGFRDMLRLLVVGAIALVFLGMS